MAVQKRNDELVNLLTADFVRRQLPAVLYGTDAGWGVFELTAVAGTAQVILPDASYDAGSGVLYSALVVDSGGGVVMSVGSLTPNTDDIIYDDGTDVCTLRHNSDGSLDVRRTSGSATFTVNLTVQWI